MILPALCRARTVQMAMTCGLESWEQDVLRQQDTGRARLEEDRRK